MHHKFPTRPETTPSSLLKSLWVPLRYVLIATVLLVIAGYFELLSYALAFITLVVGLFASAFIGHFIHRKNEKESSKTQPPIELTNSHITLPLIKENKKITLPINALTIEKGYYWTHNSTGTDNQFGLFMMLQTPQEKVLLAGEGDYAQAKQAGWDKKTVPAPKVIAKRVNMFADDLFKLWQTLNEATPTDEAQN